MIQAIIGIALAAVLAAILVLVRPRGACDGNCAACLRGCALNSGDETHE